MDAERGLMARVARGDQAAFTELAQRYSGKLLGVAGRRRRPTRPAHEDRSAAGELSAGSSNHHPPAAYLDLHRALEQVPREARVLLALRYVDGLSYGELARIRGISINTVKSQLARGKSLLRAELGK